MSLDHPRCSASVRVPGPPDLLEEDGLVCPWVDVEGLEMAIGELGGDRAMIPWNALGVSPQMPATSFANFPGIQVSSSDSTGPTEQGVGSSPASRYLAAVW